jgi:hypothetical protein
LLNRSLSEVEPGSTAVDSMLVAVMEEPVSKPSPPKVNWQPISALPLIASLIDGLLDEVERQYENP